VNLEKKYNFEKIKKSRDRRSFVFTLKSYFIDFLMNETNQNDYFFYLDSDLYFFCGIENLEKNIANGSVYISPHNFDNENKYREIYGKYNAGLMLFKNDEEGNKLLNWWKNMCTEKCSLETSQNSYADQKYLDKFISISNKVRLFDNPGINLAPWNFKKFNYHIKQDELYVDDSRLILFHFHSFKKIFLYYYKLGIKDYNVKYDQIINFIYTKYAKNLNNNINKYSELNKISSSINLPSLLISFLKNDIKRL